VRVAFKEWAVIVDALGRGDQILVLRKGGIHEDSAFFQPEHDRFWLFPTLFHQQKDSVIPTARARFEDSVEPILSEEFVHLQFFVELHSTVELTSPDGIVQLDGQHIWKRSVIEERFDWGGRKSIYALLLRVFKLPAPVQLPRLPVYGGCRSWIELEQELSVAGLTPVLTDDVFQSKAASVMNALTKRTTLS